MNASDLLQPWCAFHGAIIATKSSVLGDWLTSKSKSIQPSETVATLSVDAPYRCFARVTNLC